MTKIDAVRTDGWEELRLAELSPPLRYAAALLLTALATLVAAAVEHEVHIPNVSLIFVIPVVVAAANFGWGPSLAAAVMGALAYNFFLTEPRYSLQVEDPANIWAIGLLFVVGTLVSAVASAARRRGKEAALRVDQLGELERLGRQLVQVKDADTAANATAKALSRILSAEAAVVHWSGSEAAPRLAGAALTEADLAVARGVAETGQVARAGAYPAHASRFDFWPVTAPDGAGAAIGVDFEDGARPSALPELVGVASQSLALALARINEPKR